MPLLAIVVPCFNEEEIIEQTFDVLVLKTKKMINEGKICQKSFICFVDDGSSDATWKLIGKKIKDCRLVKTKAIRLSKNEGHQNALIAGLMEVKDRCDCVITIDGDLQQDEEKIDEFVEKFNMGSEIVLGVRNNRKTDGIFKKTTALLFYKIMEMMGAKTIKNHADYRLIGKQALRYLLEFKERNLFLRGLILELGFKVDFVYFNVKKRIAGNSKYSFVKMFSLAWDGIASSSIFPLRIIAFVGFLIFLISSFLGFYGLFASFVLKTAIPGWTSTVVPMYFLGGIQLLGIGILGEYIGKIYKETKRRPKYFIKERVESE